METFHFGNLVETFRNFPSPNLEAWKLPLDRESFQIFHWYIVLLLIIRYTQISVIRNRVNRHHVPFLSREPHTKYTWLVGSGVSRTRQLWCPVIQNVWAPYLTMRHVLLESFVWEEAIHVPFLNRGVSYDWDLSVLYCSTTVLYGYSIGYSTVRLLWNTGVAVLQYCTVVLAGYRLQYSTLRSQS